MHLLSFVLSVTYGVGKAGLVGLGFYSPPPATIIICVQMVPGSLIWDNRWVTAQLGPGPLCLAMMGQPQLEKKQRPWGSGRWGGQGGWPCSGGRCEEQMITPPQKAI